MAGGRPTKYHKDMPEQARKLCLLGATNEQLAAAFEVSIESIQGWLRNKPEFLQAVKDGRENADGQIAGALYQKAMGGDTTAMIFWLKNRRAANWREKHEVDHTGQLDLTVITRKIVK